METSYSEWFQREVEKGFAAAERDDFIDYEELGRRLNKYLSARTALTDEEFEELSERTELVKLERAKDGSIIANPRAGGYSSSANSEITYQLSTWWTQHRRGKAFGSNTGFFLPDGSSPSPSAAYVAQEQVQDLSRENRRHFLRFAPAFIIELLSATDHLPKTKARMEQWLANGTQLGWLIDPYNRNVWVYKAGEQPRLETSDRVVGTGPVEGFVLELADLWCAFEDSVWNPLAKIIPQNTKQL
jgi:Uma2 family endonuclease